MLKIDNAQASLRGFKHYPSTTITPKLPPFMGSNFDMGENRDLFKMFYLANKNGESYDGFKKG